MGQLLLLSLLYSYKRNALQCSLPAARGWVAKFVKNCWSCTDLCAIVEYHMCHVMYIKAWIDSVVSTRCFARCLDPLRTLFRDKTFRVQFV